jgi:succinoglycan biosynthesis transport protein ExoP
MDLNQFMLALRARRKAFLIAVAATIMTAVAVALVIPKKYVGTATVLADARDEQSMSTTRMSPRERAGYMTTQAELVASTRVAKQVARELKLAQRPGVRTAWESSTGGVGSIDDWIADQLREKLEVDTSASNLILINFASSDPKYAAEVANAFAKVYLDTVLQLRTEPTREAVQWFDNQLKTLRTQVTTAQSKLNAFQKQKGILAEDARLDVESARLSELSTQLLAARNATYEAQSRHRQALEILKEGTSPDALPEVLANAHISLIKADLARAEGRHEQEGTVLGPNHPQYLRTAAEIDGLRARLQAEMKKVVGSLGTVVAQNKRREQELQAAIDAQNQRLHALREYRIEMTAMSRDIEAAQRSYDTVLTRYMTAKIEASAKQTNVALLSPAVEPITPLHPKVGLIAGLSVILGLMLATGIVYVLESLDRRVRSRFDLESRLAVPSLGLLSNWQTASSRRLLPAPGRLAAGAPRALPNPW